MKHLNLAYFSLDSKYDSHTAIVGVEAYDVLTESYRRPGLALVVCFRLGPAGNLPAANRTTNFAALSVGHEC